MFYESRARTVRGPTLPVPEIIQYICHRTRGVTETTAQATIRDLLCLLARTYTDEVVLVLFKIQDQSRSSRVRRLWEMLASVPRGYEEIMESLQQRMTQRPEPGAPEPRDRRQISPLMATRAIHELLLEPRQRVEVQSLFASLFMALLLRTSFLVAVGGTEPSWDQQHGTESMDPMSSTVDALKALMRSAGYGDHVSYVQKLGGWELLASRERHHEGVALLARAMVIKSCWHNRPVFSLVIGALQAHDGTDHLTALTFATEVSGPQCGRREEEVPLGHLQGRPPRRGARLPVARSLAEGLGHVVSGPFSRRCDSTWCARPPRP
ncbi:maestro heat-like repeat-containing protein family member 7 [Pteropus vampyrus]|uniref:Maestro heat-like repeat-containing protein family member 7 n=1 Tax=Pteropus vampyrus TaxID=132908 RepID=A0A6P6CT02_PTEVA|nr:maestro heat-like repeat-containing protein family member 7 [Pteropus vampyrus]